MNTEYPPLPPDHPLSPYADYMINTVADLKILMIVTSGAVIILALAFAFFAIQKYRQRHEDKQQQEADQQFKADVVVLMESCRLLLSTIRGWAVVSVSTEDRKTRELKDAAKEMKEHVDKIREEVPDATADKVLERLKPPESVDSSVSLAVIKPQSDSQKRPT